MPFKSQAQAAAIYALEKQGKVAKGTFRKWAKETGKKIRELPERVGSKRGGKRRL